MVFRRWIQARARVFERLECRYLLNVGDLYSVPTNPRVATNLDASWKFALNPERIAAECWLRRFVVVGGQFALYLGRLDHECTAGIGLVSKNYFG